MKRLTVSILILISIFSLSFPKNIMNNKNLNFVFDLDALPELTISVSKAEWNRLLSNFDMNAKNEIYVKADFSFNKEGKIESIKNVGLRLRGNIFSKAKPENAKQHDGQNPRWFPSHFRINFDKFNKKNKFHSLDALNLKAFNGDPSFVREIYSLDLFHRFGVYTAQRSSYVRLTIHVKGDNQPAYFGIYRMLEPLDDKYIAKRFSKKKENGFLWKCLYPADLTLKGDLTKMGIEDPDNGRSFPYDLKTRKKELKLAKKKFHQFITDLNTKEGDEFIKWAEKNINIELLLKAQAVNVMLGMWDDYWINNNNYYLYMDDNDLMHFIPYDYDNSLGTSAMNNVGQASVFNWGAMDNSRPLMFKVLSVEKYKKQYGHYIAELISATNDLFHHTQSTNRIINWHKLIEPYVENDTGVYMEIIDSPARWGNAPYYRLLSGDHYGGPLEANYFLTRTVAAEVDLGLREKMPKADIVISIKGVTQHDEKKYYYTYQDKQKITLHFKTKHKLKKVILKGIVNKTIEMPKNTVSLDIDLGDKKQLYQVSPGWIPRGILSVVAIDENNQGVEEYFAVLKINSDYKSPEISGDTVTFRLKYAGDNQVALHGNFNEWGKQKILLKKVSKDMWEYTMKLKDIKTIPSKNDPPNIVRYGFMILEDTPRWTSDKVNINSRRGSSFFYLD